MNALTQHLTNKQVFRAVLVGTYIVVDSWKLYLIFRNISMLRNMANAPPELDINPVLYERMQLLTQYESEHILFATICELNITVAKLVFNYFPRIWQLLSNYGYGTSVVRHSVWFAVVDSCNEVALAIPLVIINSLVAGRGYPWVAVLGHLFEMAFRGLFSALGMYVTIYVTGNFGVGSILKGYLAMNTLGFIFMAFYYKFLMSLDHEQLPDNETGKSVRALAKQVGYPADTIYIDKRSPEPNAFYSSAIFSRTIIITESLLASLDAPQVTSVVAHELGHWANCHPLYTYLGHTLEITAIGYVWILAYGSSTMIEFLELDPNVHPVIPVYVAFHLIWPPLRDLIHGTFNLIKTKFEFVADDYACKVCRPMNLRQALVKVSLQIKSFPLLDNWFTAWFIGHPSILQRIRRIDARLGMK